MADVFLSYKREDSAPVRRLLSALRQRGLDVWWDEDIPPSAPWEPTIEKELAEARAVIVCWSPASVASENVRSEARVARQDGRLIQAFIKPCTPPLFFGERQGVDLTKWRGDAHDPRVSALIEAIRKNGPATRVEATDTPKVRSFVARARARGRLLAAVAAVVLVLGTVGALAFRTLARAATPEVAVLPFEDLSPNHDKAYFAEGVSEEILSSLSTDKALKVLGRASARQIDQNANPETLRRSLGVTHLLEGSARTAGDALRVDVRLIDTKDGSTLWQKQYEGRLSDVFQVQDQIATGVVKQLQGFFAGGPAIRDRPATTAQAYDDYLAARALMRTRSIPTLKKALVLAKRVIDAEPNYAPAQALFGELVFHLSDDPLEYGDIPVEQARSVARAHALRAIQLQPKAADGYAVLGMVSPGTDAISPLKRAIALDPSRADFRIWLEEAYAKVGRYDDAFDQAQRAVEIEPLWAVVANRLVLILASSRRFDQAQMAVQQFESIGGDRGQALRFRAGIARRQGDHARSIFFIEQALKVDPTLPYVRGQLANEYHLLGLGERARAAFPANENEPLHKLFIEDQRALLVERARADPGGLINAPDLDFAIFTLGAARAWGPLTQLYRAAGMNPVTMCAKLPSMSLPLGLSLHVAQALAATGNQQDARSLIECVRERLARTFKQSYRWGDETTAEPEIEEAMVLALTGDKNGAVNSLSRAVDLGWLGYPYSSQLADWPEFDNVRGDSRLAALQSRMNRKIAQLRARLISRQR